MFGINIDKEAQRLQAFYDAARSRLGEAAGLHAAVPEVSGWSPAEHLHHAALVNTAVFERMRRWLGGELEGEDGSPNLAGRLVLWLGRLPRGRGRSPAAFQLEGTSDLETLAAAVHQSQEAMDAIIPDLDALRQCTGGQPHPALGVLTAPQWLRFARIHAEHHLTIVRDIDEQQP
ncbi:MAG: DUF1569 domain-containing protein [Bacteroidetes bacterium]|jgi:hypothetical protein|nr:DUF1569 domain-containing protein [Bacteroidota bacterium]